MQKVLQLVTYEFDQAALNVAVGHVDHEDVGGRVGTLVVLDEEKTTLTFRLRWSLMSSHPAALFMFTFMLAYIV